MRLHSIQHVPYEGTGAIGDWAERNGFAQSVTRQDLGESLPRADAFDLLVVMGGPMGTHDHEEHSWLPAEERFIREVIDRGTPVLGVCLGAQLIAQALGADVRPNPVREIGWFPIFRAPGAINEPVLNHLPEQMDVLHWHGDRFDLPEGATCLWSSEACDNQGFIVGKTLGLQFHFEMTPLQLNDLCEASFDELAIAGTSVQTAAEMRQPQHRFEACSAWLYQLLDNWWALHHPSG